MQMQDLERELADVERAGAERARREAMLVAAKRRLASASVAVTEKIIRQIESHADVDVADLIVARLQAEAVIEAMPSAINRAMGEVGLIETHAAELRERIGAARREAEIARMRQVVKKRLSTGETPFEIMAALNLSHADFGILAR